VRDSGDPAGLPLLLFLFALFLFVATPLVNTIIRSNEVEADIVGLNIAREPEAWSTGVLKLANTASSILLPWRSGCSTTIPAAATAYSWPCAGKRSSGRNSCF